MRLLPCPCGGTPELTSVNGLHYKHRVVCSKCGAISGNGTVFQNDEWNIKQWNQLVGGNKK